MKFLKIFSLVILSTASIFGQGISDYVPITGWGVSKNNSEELIILRKFFKYGFYYYFTLSPKSLNTKILSADSISINQASWETIQTKYSSTPYIHALKLAELHSDTLQDAGFTRFLPSQKGIDLTIDLCPSQRPLDRIVFTDLINEIGLVEKPVPIAVSITGRWISEHPGDLDWLDSLERADDLSILWINHSYNHHTYKNVPLKRNFMLAPGTDINSEVLSKRWELYDLRESIIDDLSK